MNSRGRIIFDETHNEGGKLNITYTTVNELLDKEQIECYSLSDFPITYDKIKKYDVLVIAGPDMSKFRPSEINEVINYVNDGGNLILMSDAGGDRGHMTNLNKIAQPLGFQFNSDQVIDSKFNLGMETVPVLAQVTPHDIMRGVAGISYRAGCSISVNGDINILLKSNQTSEPPNAPIIVLAKYGSGQAVGIGTYEIFRDKIIGGIKTKYHDTLLINICEFLLSTKKQDEPEKITVEELAEEESSPLKQELENIEMEKSKLEKSKAPSYMRLEEAKITPLRESDRGKTPAIELKELSEAISIIASSIKEQLYSNSELHEKLLATKNDLDRLVAAVKGSKIEELYTAITEIKTMTDKLEKSFEQIAKSIIKLAKPIDSIKTELIRNQNILSEEIKASSSNANMNYNKIINELEGKIKLLEKEGHDTLNSMQVFLRSEVSEKISENAKTQQENMKTLERKIIDSLEKIERGLSSRTAAAPVTSEAVKVSGGTEIADKRKIKAKKTVSKKIAT